MLMEIHLFPFLYIKMTCGGFTGGHVLDNLTARDGDLPESCRRLEVARQPAKNSRKLLHTAKKQSV